MKYPILFLALFISISFLSAQNTATPKPNHDFNFWLGKWDVYHTTADTIVGYSQIESIIDSFAIRESYQAAGSPYQGTSLNKYNPATQQWEQYWIDNGGLTLHLKGNREGGKMILQSQSETPNGPYANKITWYDQTDGTVRQVWEISQDEGKTWTAVFDGTYKKVKQ